MSYNQSVENDATRPRIPESFFEHRQFFTEPWVERWTIPNPFISALLAPLRPLGVGLADFSFNKDPANVGETYLNISIRGLNAVVRIGLDTVTFIAANPDWEMAPQFVPIFDQISERVRGLLGIAPKSQEATLAFHVTPGASDFRQATASLVNRNVVGECHFYGVSLHRGDGALIIDRSLRYEGAAFVRLQRIFDGDTRFTEVASRLYEDEVAALRLLGIVGWALERCASMVVAFSRLTPTSVRKPLRHGLP
jgi:hypothetical protein